MLFERIPENEKTLIERYIDTYACGHKAPRTADLQYILRFWETHKVNLYEILGNELIISKEISYEKDENELLSEYNNICYDSDSPFEVFRRNYVRKLNELNFSYPLYDRMSSLMYYENIIRNRYENIAFDVPLPNGKKYTVLPGTKVMRALAKISSAFGIEGFEEFRLAHSQLLNDKTMSGELCLSIHPLDFMTMSDNDSDWESCMNWRYSGDYRRGTVVMMNSPMVVVAYLKRSEDMTLFTDSTWNNKKWRELFIISEEGIFGIKGYPFWNRSLENIVLDWLVELTNNWGKMGHYSSEAINFENHGLFKVNDNFYCYGMHCDTMYNDFYDTHKVCLNDNATPMPIDYNGIVSENPIEVYFSGEDECMACGSIANGFETEYDLLCTTCYDPLRCYGCGNVIEESEIKYEVDGEYYCSYCYENLPICDICGEKHNWRYMRNIYVAIDHDKVVGRIEMKFCEDHVDTLPFKIHKANYGNWYGDIEYCLLSDLTDEQRMRVFGLVSGETYDECVKYIEDRIEEGSLFYINRL